VRVYSLKHNSEAYTLESYNVVAGTTNALPTVFYTTSTYLWSDTGPYN